MNFSFIHMADIHLGRLFSGLSAFSYDINSLDIYTTAIKNSLNNIITIAIEKNVDFIFIAGDTFDSGEQDFSSKLILKDYLKKLTDLNIKVFLICGNHDPLSSYNKNTFNYDKESPVKIIGLNTESSCELPLYNKKNELVGIVHALSFTNEKFNQNPLQYFNKPNTENNSLFHIGLLHCDLDGDKASPYSPCTKSELLELNYNYWALGHIHIPTLSNDIIQYAGTIQGRNTKETDEHGIRYVEVENNNIIQNTFIPTDVIRFCDIEIDISSAVDSTETVSLIEERINTLISKNSTIVYLLKITLIGNINFYSEINDEFIEALSNRVKDLYSNKIYISKIENAASPFVDSTILVEDEGITGEIYKTITNNDVFTDTCSAIFEKYKYLLDYCNFDEEELNTFKEELINEVQREGINICSSLYNMKEDE